MKYCRASAVCLIAFLLAFAAFAIPPDRAAVLDWFDREIYGTIPPRPARLAFEPIESGEAFEGAALRRQYRLVSTDAKGTHSFNVLVYLPKGAERPAPAFVYPNFSGNHTLSEDPAVEIETCRVLGGRKYPRGGRSDRVPVRRIVERGFAFVTYCYSAVYPDYGNERRDAAGESVYAIFPEEKLVKPFLAHPAWSWGAMRVRDLVETIPEINGDHVAIVGQSRMGKNAIITGVHDPRFALTVANCGGTKSLKFLPNLIYPFWFAKGLEKYARIDKTGQPIEVLEARAAKMPDPPHDQHELMALIAPRALYVGAASGDRWSPPAASLACVRKALPAFERLGLSIGWHCKQGPHSIVHADWERFMDYALDRLAWHSAYSPAVPSANPDDQMRFIWGSHNGIYTNLLRFGFNTIINQKAPAGVSEFAADGMDLVLQNGTLNAAGFQKRYPRINRDGTKWERTADATDPAYRAEQLAIAKTKAAAAKDLPCRVGIQPTSEVRIRTRPSFTARHAAAFKAATGLDVPPEAKGRAAPHWSKLKDIPADRAIDENHPVLAFYRWFWKVDDGWDPSIAAFEREYRQALGYVPFSFIDPAIREPPLWTACPSLSHISQWQTVAPNPYQHSYIISELKAMARGNPGQRTFMMVQGIFARWAASGKLLAGVDGATLPDAPAWLRDRPFGLYITPPPDMFRESIWACLSRQIDGVGFHGWNCLFDGVPFGDKKTAKGYVFTNDRTTNVIDEVFTTAAVPLGPLFKAAPERVPEVVVLESYASALLSGSAPWDWKIAGFHCGVAATAANLAPGTLYEEEIARDGIPLSVKVILAPKCEVVTRTTATALKAFRASGGRIVADETLAPAVTADVTLAADAMTKDPAAIGAAVRRFVIPHADTDRPTLLASARHAGPGADLLFVLNDKRTFGDYIGQWKQTPEQGVAERGNARVRRSAGAVYDLVRHAAVPFRSRDGVTEIPVAFETTGGRALLVCKRPLAPLAVSIDCGARGVTVEVTSPDADVMIPIRVERVGKRPYYGLVKGGVWRHVFASGDEIAAVASLADGSAARRR